VRNISLLHSPAATKRFGYSKEKTSPYLSATLVHRLQFSSVSFITGLPTVFAKKSRPSLKTPDSSHKAFT